MQVTINKCSYTDKKKDGSECRTKQGKTFYKVGIKTNEHGDEWINGLVFDAPPTDWEGKTMELDIKEEEYQGKTSLKFELPRKGKNFADIEQLKTTLGKMDYKLDTIIKHLSKVEPLDRTSDGGEMPPF